MELRGPSTGDGAHIRAMYSVSVFCILLVATMEFKVLVSRGSPQAERHTLNWVQKKEVGLAVKWGLPITVLISPTLRLGPNPSNKNNCRRR